MDPVEDLYRVETIHKLLPQIEFCENMMGEARPIDRLKYAQ